MSNTGKKKWIKAIPVDIEKLYENVDEPLPHSAKRWWWCWGGIVGLLFALQALTGLLLAFYYRAEPQTAYESVKYISEHARFGLFIRSVHQWGATFMVVFLFLHMTRVFITGAFREYRWGGWMAGVFLLAVTLGMAFTGYSLVQDQLSYWGVTVSSNILLNVPLVGSALRNLFLAGSTINESTLSRMYALHVQILPVSLMLLGAVHIFFVRLFGMFNPGTEKDRLMEKSMQAKKGVYHFYPDHMISEIAVFLYILLIICVLAYAYPAHLGPAANPLVTPEHIKPEWYFYPFFHLLKLMPGPIGVSVMFLLGIVVFILPILDQYIFQKIDRIFKGRMETSIILGVLTLVIYLAWAFIEA